METNNENKEEMQLNWASGIVKTINPELRGGIIQQIDGIDVLFAFSDMESGDSPSIGQEVLYSLEKDPLLGLKARHITALNLGSKA